MGFSEQESTEWIPIPSPRDLPAEDHESSAVEADALTSQSHQKAMEKKKLEVGYSHQVTKSWIRLSD